MHDARVGGKVGTELRVVSIAEDVDVLWLRDCGVGVVCDVAFWEGFARFVPEGVG